MASAVEKEGLTAIYDELKKAIATTSANVATAEALIHSLSRGDLDYRTIMRENNGKF